VRPSQQKAAMIVKSVRAIFRFEKISSPRSSVFRCCPALLLIAAGTAAAEAAGNFEVPP